MSNFNSNWIKLFIFCELFSHIQSSIIHPFIVYGHVAKRGQFPYQVALEAMGHFGCGGVLIKNDAVLTAAHCIRNNLKNDLEIRAGSLCREKGGEIQKVCKIIVHPEYSRSSQGYDIAILKLCEPFKLNRYIKTIPLIKNEPKAKSQATISGWGQTESGELSNKLKYATVIIKSREYCHRIPYMTESDICAQGTNDESPWYGDSGGPLTVNGKLAGITSRGYCPLEGYKGLPGFYANIAYLKDFIEEHVDL